MIDREIKLPPIKHYPPEPWRFVQSYLNKEMIGRDEAIFTVSNGYIGIRGAFEEGEPVEQKATFISGFHETWPITYGEEAYGFAKTGQTMLPVTDASTIKLFIDDESFSLRHAYMRSYERALDFKEGTLKRSLIWDTASGKQIRIDSERLVSFPERHLAAIKYTVTMLNSDAHMALASEMLCEQVNSHREEDDPRIAHKIYHEVFIPEAHYCQDERVMLGHSTAQSQMKMVCGMDHHVETACSYSSKSRVNDFSGDVTYVVEARKDQPFTLYKFITYHTSSPVPTIEDLMDRAMRTLDRSITFGWNKLQEDQRAYLDRFWEKSDILIQHPDEGIQQGIRLHLYHLLQASARVQNSGIGAKGLTGSGYEGHSFWDTEIYLLPFLIYNSPRIAKNILIFRYNMLEKARSWAAMLNHKGALFPWRTINGDEASAYFAAGTAQYHINADISYAIKKYNEVTGDDEFLYHFGSEMLVETARLWADLGFYGRDGKFHIHGVTGPDEYNAIVNNNTFTNLMARENLRYAVHVVTEMKENVPELFEQLVHKTKFRHRELDEWKKAAENMYIPYNEELGINPQDDAFLQKEKWDLKNTPKDKFPLLLHYHPLELYRYQVIKQADVVLATFLLGNEFSDELKKKNFDYYDPLTTGDSSLSVCIQGIMAAELNYDLAMKYFRYASLMDLANIGGNVEHGLHLASMGGIWMFVIYGAAGVRDYNGKLTFKPENDKFRYLERLSFRLTFHNKLIEVDLRPGKARYHLIEGDQIEFEHRGKNVSLKTGEETTFDD